jgi:alginate O-acetyltransferase complex protein AlgI
MLFSSLSFIYVFLPVTLLLHYAMPNIKSKNFILLVFSLIFYAWGEPIYVSLMLLSIFINYFHAIKIEKSLNDGKTSLGKFYMVSSIVLNLLLLGIFKYADFIISILNSIPNFDIAPLNILLPIGISFYTFQAMSYTIDVYRRKIPAQRNFLTLATYVSIFPQLIAGPIVRYETIQRELTSRQVTIDNFTSGINRFIRGLAKKVLIANNVGVIAESIFTSNINDVPTLIAWLGIIAYTLQIYFDFSGYSDMAIGMGKALGFTFLENFNYPYISKSITEFWRRWHISLSTWFRDYLYISLGGNRVKPSRWVVNILLVWMLTGLWHGSSWNFVIWGLYYGVLLIVEKIVTKVVRFKPPGIVRYLYTILLIMIGWVFFRIENIGDCIVFIERLFVDYIPTNLSSSYVYKFVGKLPFIGLGIALSFPLANTLFMKLEKSKHNYIFLLTHVLLLLLSTFTLVNGSFNPFIYFKF